MSDETDAARRTLVCRWAGIAMVVAAALVPLAGLLPAAEFGGSIDGRLFTAERTGWGTGGLTVGGSPAEWSALRDHVDPRVVGPSGAPMPAVVSFLIFLAAPALVFGVLIAVGVGRRLNAIAGSAVGAANSVMTLSALGSPAALVFGIKPDSGFDVLRQEPGPALWLFVLAATTVAVAGITAVYATPKPARPKPIIR